MTDKKIEYYVFPPIRSKLITMAETDQNHYPVDGDDLILWMPQYRDLEYRGYGERWISQNGSKPRNTDRAYYAKNAIIYSNSFEFTAFSMCTEGMIVGNNHTTSEAGRAYLDYLYAATAIRKIGKVESNGNWNAYNFMPEGIDLLFDVQSVIIKNTVRPLNEKGNAAAIPSGPLYMATSALVLSRSSPNTAAAGLLIPEGCLSGGAAGLIKQGRVILAGSLADQFSDIDLRPAVANLYRAIAVIDADCRARGKDERRTDEQVEYIATLFKAAIESAPVCS